MKDQFEQFSRTTVVLHWIIAIGMIAMLAFGLYIHDMPRGPDKGALIGIHKSVGLLILVLASVRILWRMRNRFPKPLSAMSGWQAFLAKFAHWFLIIGTVMMPISGVIMSIGSGRSVAFFGMELIAAGDKNPALAEVGHIMHGLGGRLLILFVILHIVGALKHQFMDRDGTLSRMLGKKVGGDHQA